MVEPWEPATSPCSSSFRDFEAKQKAMSLYRELVESGEGLTTAKVRIISFSI